jgi:hypothetical protein
MLTASTQKSALVNVAVVGIAIRCIVGAKLVGRWFVTAAIGSVVGH